MIHSNSKGEKFPLNPCAPDPEFTFPEAAMVSNLLGILESVLHMCADPGVIPPHMAAFHMHCAALRWSSVLAPKEDPCSLFLFSFYFY